MDTEITAGRIRCPWTRSPLMDEYHDAEWGVPLHDDRKHFEFLILDAFQAGLSWAIVLTKREGFRAAFHRFDPAQVAEMSEDDVEELMTNPTIIRNRLKIRASIKNAKAFLNVQREFGTFDAYIWQFTGGKTLKNSWTELRQLPARTAESDAMSKDLKRRGFTFVGSTICYAYMQAAGMVNDHVITCFRHGEV